MGRDWLRILQWPLLLASAGVAAWVSYTQQRQLGIDVGWDHPWGLPIILDGLAAATLLSYIRKPTKFNSLVSTLVVATAVVGNAQAAIYDANTANLPAPLWAVIAWKVLPPVAVFTIAHYIAHERKETGEWVPKSQSVPSPSLTPGTAAPASVASSSATAKKTATSKRPPRRTTGGVSVATPAAGTARDSKTDEQLVKLTMDQGWSTLSGDELAARLHVAKGRALTVRTEARRLEALSAGNGKVLTAANS